METHTAANEDSTADERKSETVGGVRSGGVGVPSATARSYRTGAIVFGNDFIPDAVYTDDDGNVWRIVTNQFYDERTGRLHG